MQGTRTQKRVCKDKKKIFQIKHVGVNHDLYVQSDRILLSDVFETFANMSLTVHELDPGKQFLSSRISMASSFKKD